MSFSHLLNGYKPGMKWIKQPDNMRMICNSLHMLDIRYLNREYDLRSFVDIYIPQAQWIDSLELTYKNYQQSPTYYREFWQRRMAEGNAESTYEVVSLIKLEMIDSAEVEMPFSYNDTLVDLLLMHLPLADRPAIPPQEDLQKLINYGLHQSAYNIVSGERYQYDDVKWDSPIDSIILKLEPTDSYQPAWLEDNTK